MITRDLGAAEPGQALALGERQRQIGAVVDDLDHRLHRRHRVDADLRGRTRQRIEHADLDLLLRLGGRGTGQQRGAREHRKSSISLPHSVRTLNVLGDWSVFCKRSSIDLTDMRALRAPMSRDLIIQAIVSGLLMGLIYALVAVGLSLIFGLMEIVNFAHGEFLMLAMFAAFWLWALAGLDPLLSLPLVAAHARALPACWSTSASSDHC